MTDDGDGDAVVGGRFLVLASHSKSCGFVTLKPQTS